MLRTQHLVDEVTITLLYPHWRAGTLPISSRVHRLSPTAYESARVRFTLSDGKANLHQGAIGAGIALVNVREFSEEQNLIFATRKGTVKKTKLSAYGNVRATGIIAINIEDGDELIDVQVTDGTNDIVLATAYGMSIRFHEKDVREMGRDTTGVKGIALGDGDGVRDAVGRWRLRGLARQSGLLPD